MTVGHAEGLLAVGAHVAALVLSQLDAELVVAQCDHTRRIERQTAQSRRTLRRRRR